MRTIARRAALAAIAVACLSLSACENKGKTVQITYQHLGNAQSWNLENVSGSDANGMWHVYMLRGVVNQGENAAPFTFDLNKVALKDGSTVASASGPMLHAAPYVLSLGFKANVAAKSAYTVPYGKGVMFIIKEDGDTDKTAATSLTYKSEKGESVLITALDPKAVPAFGSIDQAFLQTLHSKQNDYENSYTPDGKKK